MWWHEGIALLFKTFFAWQNIAISIALGAITTLFFFILYKMKIVK
jgi:hypothetical protein